MGTAPPWGSVSALLLVSPAREGTGQSPQTPKTPVHPHLPGRWCQEWPRRPLQPVTCLSRTRGRGCGQHTRPVHSPRRPSPWSLQKASSPVPGLAHGGTVLMGPPSPWCRLPLRVPGTPGRGCRAEAAVRELPEHSALRLEMGGWNGVTEGRLRGFQVEGSGNRAVDTAEGWALSRVGEVQGAAVEADVGTRRPAGDGGAGCRVLSCQLCGWQGPPGGKLPKLRVTGIRRSETPDRSKPPPSGRRVPGARGRRRRGVRACGDRGPGRRRCQRAGAWVDLAEGSGSGVSVCVGEDLQLARVRATRPSLQAGSAQRQL